MKNTRQIIATIILLGSLSTVSYAQTGLQNWLDKQRTQNANQAKPAVKPTPRNSRAPPKDTVIPQSPVALTPLQSSGKPAALPGKEQVAAPAITEKVFTPERVQLTAILLVGNQENFGRRAFFAYQQQRWVVKEKEALPWPQSAYIVTKIAADRVWLEKAGRVIELLPFHVLD